MAVSIPVYPGRRVLIDGKTGLRQVPPFKITATDKLRAILFLFFVQVTNKPVCAQEKWDWAHLDLL